MYYRQQWVENRWDNIRALRDGERYITLRDVADAQWRTFGAEADELEWCLASVLRDFRRLMNRNSDLDTRVILTAKGKVLAEHMTSGQICEPDWLQI